MAWIRPVGELDRGTAPELDACLGRAREEGLDRLVVDLRGITFIDARAVNIVVAWHRRSHRDGFGFAVVDGPRIVQRVFEISGLYGVLRFVDGD